MNIGNILTWAGLELFGAKYYEELHIVEKSLDGNSGKFKFVLCGAGYEARIADDDAVAMSLATAIQLAGEFVKNSPKQYIEFVKETKRAAINAGICFDNAFVCIPGLGANCAKLAK